MTSEEMKYFLLKRLQRDFRCSDEEMRLYLYNFFGGLFKHPSVVVTESAFRKFLNIMDTQLDYCASKGLHTIRSAYYDSGFSNSYTLLQEAFLEIDIDFTIERGGSDGTGDPTGRLFFTLPDGTIQECYASTSDWDCVCINCKVGTDYEYMRAVLPTFTLSGMEMHGLDEVNTQKCGRNVTWSYDPSTMTMEFSGTGATYGVNFFNSFEFSAITPSLSIPRTYIFGAGIDCLKPQTVCVTGSKIDETVCVFLQDEYAPITLETDWLTRDTEVSNPVLTIYTNSRFLRDYDFAALNSGIEFHICPLSAYDNIGIINIIYNNISREYAYELNTSWTSWVNSLFNSIQAYVDGEGYICYLHGGRSYYLTCNNTRVIASDSILPNTSYSSILKTDEAQLNICCSSTPPTDTSKLWAKTTKSVDGLSTHYNVVSTDDGTVLASAHAGTLTKTQKYVQALPNGEYFEYGVTSNETSGIQLNVIYNGFNHTITLYSYDSTMWSPSYNISSYINSNGEIFLSVFLAAEYKNSSSYKGQSYCKYGYVNLSTMTASYVSSNFYSKRISIKYPRSLYTTDKYCVVVGNTSSISEYRNFAILQADGSSTYTTSIITAPKVIYGAVLDKDKKLTLLYDDGTAAGVSTSGSLSSTTFDFEVLSYSNQKSITYGYIQNNQDVSYNGRIEYNINGELINLFAKVSDRAITGNNYLSAIYPVYLKLADNNMKLMYNYSSKHFNGYVLKELNIDISNVHLFNGNINGEKILIGTCDSQEIYDVPGECFIQGQKVPVYMWDSEKLCWVNISNDTDFIEV